MNITLQKNRYATAIILVLFCLPIASLFSQQTTRGKDFWCTFLPNYHETTNSDSLYIYIVSQVPTQGTIEFPFNGSMRSIPYSIGANAIFQYSVKWNTAELVGFNSAGTISNNPADGEVARMKSFHIIANNDVAVYALNKALRTSDATVVLPTAALNKEYVVLSYKTDGYRGSFGSTDSFTPSQFAIVANENNTQITISPKVPTQRAKSTAVQNITLQQGEVYLVQAQYKSNGSNDDLSGSRIIATKPIAVFSGHQRTTLPVEDRNLASRDHLFEQLYPTEVWGKQYILTPIKASSDETNSVSNLFRVVASTDNTRLYLDNVFITTLSAGGVYEAPLQRAGLLTSDKPIMTALYKRTSGTSGSSTRIGDPFMMIIPPRRQYLQDYRFINVQVGSTYVEQYITVIVPETSIDMLRLDGRPLSSSTIFTTIPGTCYAYSNIQMTNGAHNITCNFPFGLYVYGYGLADSYGYVGGMAFRENTVDAIEAFSSVEICSGQSAPLLVRGAFKNISWTNSSSLSCDTCQTVIASPKNTTKYYVSAVDSLGCQGLDSVTVTVRSIPIEYSLGPKESNGILANVSTDSALVLDVNATSDKWASYPVKKIQATIRYKPEFMQYKGVTRNGDALPTDWVVKLDATKSNLDSGRLVYDAFGSTPLDRNGVLFSPEYSVYFTNPPDDKPTIDVVATGDDFECVADKTRGAFVSLSVCAGALRTVEISPDNGYGIRSIYPQPTSTLSTTIEYSLAFDGIATVQIISTTGQTILETGDVFHRAGVYRYTVEPSTLPAGVYTAVLTVGMWQFTKPFVVTK